MTKEKKLEILANCGWGKDGAKARLISGTTIYDAEDEEIIANYRRMVEEKDPAPDWQIYTDNDGKLYYIQLAL